MAPSWLWKALTVARAASTEAIVLFAPATVNTFWLARVAVAPEDVVLRPVAWVLVNPRAAEPPAVPTSVIVTGFESVRVTLPCERNPPAVPIVVKPVPAGVPPVPRVMFCTTLMSLPSVLLRVIARGPREEIDLQSRWPPRQPCGRRGAGHIGTPAINHLAIDRQVIRGSR